MPPARASASSGAGATAASPRRRGRSASARRAPSRSPSAARSLLVAPARSSPPPPARLPHTVGIASVPEHLRFNRFILHGYRRSPLSTRGALWSAVGYLHNESLNIATHAVACGLLAWWVLAWLAGMGRSGPGGELRALYGAYGGLPPLLAGAQVLGDAAAALCLAGSVRYHLLMAAAPDAAAYRSLLADDLAGVLLVQGVATGVLAWLSLPCAPLWLLAAIALAPTACAAGVSLAPGASVRGRAGGFALQWAARVALVLGGAASGAARWPRSALAAHLAVEASPLLGSALNVLRLPEAAAPPGAALTTYALQSHTIMHVLVVGGMLGSHMLGAQRAAALEQDPRLMQCLSQHAAGVQAALGAWGRAWGGA